MKPYLFAVKIRIQAALAYWFNVISTILIQCLIMYAMFCFWIAAYDGTQAVSGMSQRDMITYTAISVIMGNLLAMGIQNRIAGNGKQCAGIYPGHCAARNFLKSCLAVKKAKRL